jgi:uncharacterized sporulation protein YeaH/YhbH (DUF444 family)
MAYWIDIWVRKFYDKVERCYFWHDTVAQEVDEEKFYKYRYGGGTTCSTCPKLMAKQFDVRFPPDKWNIYCFYFTDGENWDNDNDVFVDVVQKQFGSNICNLFAITQVLCWRYSGSLKQFCDQRINQPNYKSVSIGDEESPDPTSHNWSMPTGMIDEKRNEAIRKAIMHLLGAHQPKEK